MRKKVGIIKRLFCLLLIFLLSINSFAAIVSDNDGSAFITKAEFDALKSSFQSQIDTYNQSIDSKIDGAIASYLTGIKLSSQFTESIIFGDNSTVFSKISQDNWRDWDALDGMVGHVENRYYGNTFSAATGVPNNLYWMSWSLTPVPFSRWLVKTNDELRIVRDLEITIAANTGFVGSYSVTPDVDTSVDDWTWNLYFTGNGASSSIDWTNKEDAMNYVLNDRSATYGRPYGYCTNNSGSSKTAGTPWDRGPRVGFDHGADWGFGATSVTATKMAPKPTGGFVSLGASQLAQPTSSYNVSYSAITDYVLADYGTESKKTCYASCLTKGEVGTSNYCQTFLWDYNAANGGIDPPSLTMNFGMPHNKLGNNIAQAVRPRCSALSFFKSSNGDLNFGYTTKRNLWIAPKYGGQLNGTPIKQTSVNAAIKEKTGITKTLNCFDSIPICYVKNDVTNLKFTVKYSNAGVVKHPTEEMHFYISKEPIKLVDGAPDSTTSLYDNIKLNNIDTNKSNLKITLNSTNEAVFTIKDVPANSFVYLNWHNTGKTYGNSINITPTFEYTKQD